MAPPLVFGKSPSLEPAEALLNPDGIFISS